MRAPEPIPGTRVVSSAAVLDGVAVPEEHTVLRFAADELFVLGNFVLITREPAINERDAGFVGWWLAHDELGEVLHNVDWSVPDSRPVLLQGLIAGVPAKLWLDTDRALLLCAAAYAHELAERLG